jgi:DNA replication protein DnaC
MSDIKSDYSRNVWLHAEKGNGKTWLAWTLLQGALWHGIPVAYIDCSGGGLGSVCRNHNARKAAATVKTLVLDDVSRMYVTEYAAGELHNLLNDRNASHLRTLVFDQHDGKYFKRLLMEKTEGRYGASTVERLSRKGAPVIGIEMKGRNLRME